MRSTRCQIIKTETKAGTNSRQSSLWSFREKRALAAALQQYGFADTTKLSEAVQTRDETAVKHFMECWTKKVQKNLPVMNEKKDSSSNDLTGQRTVQQDVVSCPAIRCWKKIASQQVLPRLKSNDYSSILCELLNHFYEEEQESQVPNMVNVKAVYKYLLDCASGNIPAMLKPIDSAIVLLILRDLRYILHNCDFEEEKEFVQNFHSATKFVPFGVKDEFKTEMSRTEVKQNTSSSSKTEQCAAGNGAVPIPEELFQELSRHRKVKENINPLGIPLWLMAKEQGIIQCYYRDK